MRLSRRDAESVGCFGEGGVRVRSLNTPSYADLPNVAYPYLGSNRAGYIGATGIPNPYLLKVMPDTRLWQTQVESRNVDPRYGIVGSVGMGGAQIGVPATGTFVDMSEASRFHIGRYDRAEPRAMYPLRPIIAGNNAARTNPAAQWYGPGYTTTLQTQSDVLSAMLAKPSVGGYSG
jgi:hypothetical protein